LSSGCIGSNQSGATTIPYVPPETTTVRHIIEQPKLESYQDPAKAMQIKHPTTWTTQENVMGSTAVFLSPRENAQDFFQENINIISFDLAMTLDQYTAYAENQIKQSITDARIIESSPTTLAGLPAHKLVFTGRQGQNNLKWMQVWTIKNNKVYLLTYTAEEGNYNAYLPTAQEIMASFTLL
jgi:serine/threonine-protein kinase